MSTRLGRQAEAVAADFLRSQGLRLLARNWRTRWCELDLIARSRSGIHFVEVKHRQLPLHGSGLDYVTPTKQARLRRAALAWLTEQGETADYQIDVVVVSGSLADPQIEYLPNAVEDS